MAPILAIVFLIGWSLYYVGQRQQTKPQKPTVNTLQNQETVTFSVIPKEEQTITNQ